MGKMLIEYFCWDAHSIRGLFPERERERVMMFDAESSLARGLP